MSGRPIDAIVARFSDCLRAFIFEKFDNSVSACAQAADVDRSGLHRWKQGEALPSVAALSKLVAVGFDANKALGGDFNEGGEA